MNSTGKVYADKSQESQNSEKLKESLENQAALVYNLLRSDRN